MRVAVVAPKSVPEVRGGAERLYEGLTAAINRLTSHDAVLVTLESPESNFPEVLASYRRFLKLDLSAFDLVITTKYPSWMVSHPNKVVYMLHTLRGLYDTYHMSGLSHSADGRDSAVEEIASVAAAVSAGVVQASDLLDACDRAIRKLGSDHEALRFPGPIARRVIQALDSASLSFPCTKRHFSISKTVAARGYFPQGVKSGVVYPPSSLGGFHDGRSDYLFTASRLDQPKRIDLLIQAYLDSDIEVPLKIAGVGGELSRLEEMASGDQRIEFLGRVSDKRLVDLYADALAVPFVPYDEDFGLIAVEAMACGTPVVTCSDSGGVTELVDHGRNGLIADPDPQSLGAALEMISQNPEIATRMASAAHRTASAISWDKVVGALVAAGDASRALPPRETGNPRPLDRTEGQQRRKITVLTTYPFFPADSGGRIRGAHLVASLSREFDVEILATAKREDRDDITEPLPGVLQRVIRLPAALYELEAAWTASAGWVPLNDIASGLVARDAPDYIAAVRRSVGRSHATILAHPYLVSALEGIESQPPVILDSHNYETLLKAAMYPDSTVGRLLARGVESLERQAIELSTLITTCSPLDADALAALSVAPRRVEVIPNGTDIDDVAFVPPHQRAELTTKWLRVIDPAGVSGYRAIALFIASLHPPNVDAARRILNVAPDCRDTLFVLAGSHTSHFDHWNLPPNVILTGYVSSEVKRGLLSAATVGLNPMSQGSGTNLKIIEYWAAGLPTISTPFGVRGLEGVTDSHYVEADADDFGDAIVGVLNGRGSLDQMVRSSRSLVENRYSWQVLGDRFTQFVKRVVDGVG